MLAVKPLFDKTLATEIKALRPEPPIVSLDQQQTD